MTREGGPPPIPEKGEAGISEEIIHRLVESLVSMVAHVMIGGEVHDDDIKELERHVKLFLSAFESFDKPRRDLKNSLACAGSRVKQKATWISKMNFISLLNLPDVMQRFGSLRALWEGDRKGEGGLPKVKAKVRGGTKGNWSRTAATAMLCDSAVERVIKAAADSVVDSSMDQSVVQLLEAARLVTGETETSKFKNFIRYKDAREAFATLTSGQPVSVVVFRDYTYGMMLKDTIFYIPLSIENDHESKTICGATYFKFKSGEAQTLLIPESQSNDPLTDQQNSSALKYAILLPELKRENADNNNNVLHYFLTSDWEELDAQGQMNRCQVSTAVYI
jgi:hypothetical protein